MAHYNDYANLLYSRTTNNNITLSIALDIASVTTISQRSIFMDIYFTQHLRFFYLYNIDHIITKVTEPLHGKYVHVITKCI